MARLAKSLDKLRSEVKAAWPHRDTTSDGWIGDPAHAARKSKHNPGPDGIVEAIDVDEDVDGHDDVAGAELWAFVQHLLKLARSGFPALNGPGAHIIYEGRIWSYEHGWRERAYTGENAHKHHVHVACVDGSAKDSTRAWGIAALVAQARPTAPRPDRWLGLANPPMVGQDVLNVVHALTVAGNSSLRGHGPSYDRAVADVVRRFQERRRITERGVGPLTWKALREVVH